MVVIEMSREVYEIEVRLRQAQTQAILDRMWSSLIEWPRDERAEVAEIVSTWDLDGVFQQAPEAHGSRPLPLRAQVCRVGIEKGSPAPRRGASKLAWRIK